MNSYLLATVLLFAAWSGSSAEPPGLRAAAAGTPPVIDGRLDDDAWRRAEWIELDTLRPERPKSEAEWRILEKNLGQTGYERRQFSCKARAAVLHSPEGLFFALEMEDMDVVGRMKDGETLWLEDVAEIFIAPRPESGVPCLELQFSPANATLFLRNERKGPLPLRSAAAVDGTINDSLNTDRKWSVEVFLPWDMLEREKVAQRNSSTPCAVRFASWDLSLYSQLRLNRLSGPGGIDPHECRDYRNIHLR